MVLQRDGLMGSVFPDGCAPLRWAVSAASALTLAACAQVPVQTPAPVQPLGAAAWVPDGLSGRAPLPGFRAPSASACDGPPELAELAGRSQAMAHPGPTPRREGSPGSERLALAAATGPIPESPAPAHASPPLARRPPSGPAPVTAGLVDDNLDFGAYQAFRDRNAQIPHRALDISHRQRLRLRDADGRALPDTEVVLSGAAGGHWWGRTDGRGEAWLHADSVSPPLGEEGQMWVRTPAGAAVLPWQRAQRSDLEWTLPGPAQPAGPAQRLDLVFVVDATGSMGDEIAKLKASLGTIVQEISRLPSQPTLCLGLVAYRDQGDAFVWQRHGLTNRVAAFQHRLDQLQANGGGDYPEAMAEALEQAVHQLDWRGFNTRRLVVLLADAPPQLGPDRPPYESVLRAAVAKGIKIHAIGASGLDRQGEWIHRQMAQYTGGKFLFLTYANARRPDSGPGRETIHDVTGYSVATLDQLVVRLVREELEPSTRP